MKAVTTCLTLLAMLLALAACGGGSDDSPPGSGSNPPPGGGGTPAAVAPPITTQPVAQAVTAPAVATFSVIASGTAPLSYQWRSSTNGTDWTPIAAATSASYATGATAASMSGMSYSVVVSNSAGSVTSTAVQLTVTAPPPAGTGALGPLAGPSDPFPHTPAPLAVTPVAGSGSNRALISWDPRSASVASLTLALGNDAQARLQVPVNAFIDEVFLDVSELTNLTAISSAPAPFTSVLAAIRVEPGDLVTERKGINVTFTLTAALMSGVSLDDLVGFVADSDGSNLHLVPIFAGPAGAPVIQVDHLGIFGIAVASSAQRSALAAAWPTDPRDQIAAAMAPAMTAAWVNTVRPAGASGSKLTRASVRALTADQPNPLLAPLQGLFNNSVVPAFAAAYEDPAQIPAAIQTGFQFLRNAELTGLSGAGGPLQAVADDLNTRISELADRYADYVARQCTSVGGPPQLQAMLGWMRTLQLLGHASKSDELEATLPQCSQFTVTFHQERALEWHTIPGQIDTDYKLSTVIDGTTTIGLNAAITSSAMRLTSVTLQTTSNQGTTHATAIAEADTSSWAAFALDVPVLRTKQGLRSSSLQLTLHAFGDQPLQMTVTTTSAAGTRVDSDVPVPVNLSVPALPLISGTNFGPILLPPSGTVNSSSERNVPVYNETSRTDRQRVTVTLAPAR